VIGYEFLAKGFSRVNINSNEALPNDSLAGMELGMPMKPGWGFGVPAESYGFQNKRLAWEAIGPLVERGSPLRTSHMRDPVGPELHFASEQFMDEIAAATGEDPVAFRLSTSRRARQGVVKAAADKAGWQPRPSPQRDRSGDLLKGGDRVCAARRHGPGTVAEIEWSARRPHMGAEADRRARLRPDRQSGRAAAHHHVRGDAGAVACAIRRGAFRRNMVTSVDWATYPILEIQDAPEAIDVVLINRPEARHRRWRTSIRIVAAAVANAFFDATGVRLRRAPCRRAREAALAKN